MEKFMIVEEISEIRKMNGTDKAGHPEEAEAQTLVLTDGADTIAVNAYRGTVDYLRKNGAKKGTSMMVQIAVNAKEKNGEKGKFYSNNATLVTCRILAVDPLIAFL